ncbi:MFS transporter [Phenylobacterium sp.]|uniref:MFS transporter n=1 Tax=Phenylobacterium sp. TaxID=1871053 RepID=UPI002F41F394
MFDALTLKPPAVIIAARAVRAFGDGFTALLLPAYLSALGLSPLQIGLVVTFTLLGSAVFTLGVGLLAHHARVRSLLAASCALMLLTGLAFSQARAFWPLAVVGFLGTLNPSGGDVSLFLPLEHALLAHAGTSQARTRLFARYSLAGSVMVACGALAVRAVDPLGRGLGLGPLSMMQGLFVLYGLLAIPALALYARLPSGRDVQEPPRAPLRQSRRPVLRLAALFSLDSFGGGFVVQPMLVLWLFERFGLSLATAGAFFFWAGLLTAASMLVASPLARRFGLVNTMVFTHIPANVCLVGAAFAPTLPVALGLLLVRAALSSLDVPARTSYVMAIVSPAERAAAAGVTNVPRSLAAAISPSLAGSMLAASPFGLPLVLGGALKIAYDLTLLGLFRAVKPPEEATPSSADPSGGRRDRAADA